MRRRVKWKSFPFNKLFGNSLLKRIGTKHWPRGYEVKISVTAYIRWAPHSNQRTSTLLDIIFKRGVRLFLLIN